MKNIPLFLIAFIVLSSCNQKAQQTPPQATPAKPNECYQAVYEEDTIRLALNTQQVDKVSGDMQMKLYAQPIKTGTVAGSFKGDTLFVAYTFTQGANKKTVFKNPMAFLRKDGKLILGKGEIETSLGASYFVKGKPIDFEKVKYKFEPVNCTP